MSEGLDFITCGDEEGKRLDVVLAKRLQRSRSACAALIRAGHVLVAGRIAKPASVVEAKLTVHVDMPAPKEAEAQPQDVPITILYDEDSFCVVDKPAGMATHPARGNLDKTLVNALLARLGPLPSINGVRRPGIVHRLDKDTSGLLVIAKTDVAMHALMRAMAARKVRRSYDAVVWGIPNSARGEIEAPIGRDPHDRIKFAVREDGRRAITHYQVAESFASISTSDGAKAHAAALLRLELETGRTHQIRVHAAAIGHPIIGDRVYGPQEPHTIMQRQALHASDLSFAHPTRGDIMHFHAPWPHDFASLVSRLRSGGAP